MKDGGPFLGFGDLVGGECLPLAACHCVYISIIITLLAPGDADCDSVDLKNLPAVLVHRLHFQLQGSIRVSQIINKSSMNSQQHQGAWIKMKALVLISEKYM